MTIDLRDRSDSFEETLRAMFDSFRSGFFTAMPARVVSYDPQKQTISAQPAIKAYQLQPDGTSKAVDYPVIPDIPVQFPGAGGQTMTFPVSAGDECLLNFCSRSQDSWQQSGGTQVPMDAGGNNLSNAFAMLGFRSNPRALQNVSTDATEVRSDDGNTKISLSGAGGVGISTDKQVGIAAANGVNISGGAGNVNFAGTMIVTGEIILNGIHLSTHKHTGVQPGGGTSAGPTD
ncbi:Gp138 family membrane-puncturing spike protein [Bosea sp. RCC_152_1]|uniref:Gp138 family membrane-puncturing spike protein n=1 Tax=Bosea sp. RCC_152_1 TaxID=3239228 RepID=UPI003525076D